MTLLPYVLLGLALVWMAVALVLATRVQERLKRLEPRPDDVESGLTELFQQYLSGALNPALLEAFRACAAKGIGLGTVNTAVCVEVASGRYAEALRWRALCSETDLVGDYELLLRINEAEAMANLGRVEESLAWIARTPKTELTRGGRAAHRAWCFAMLKRPDDGAAELAQSSPGQLGLMFRSEWHLTACAVAIAAGLWAEADVALKKAKLWAFRASTKRNVHFGRGLLLSAQGQHQNALTHFEKGASAKYVGQGGEALLSWGDSLAALGREADARRAWALCVERDPQSPAAAVARAR